MRGFLVIWDENQIGEDEDSQYALYSKGSYTLVNMEDLLKEYVEAVDTINAIGPLFEQNYIDLQISVN